MRKTKAKSGKAPRVGEACLLTWLPQWISELCVPRTQSHLYVLIYSPIPLKYLLMRDVSCSKLHALGKGCSWLRHVPFNPHQTSLMGLYKLVSLLVPRAECSRPRSGDRELWSRQRPRLQLEFDAEKCCVAFDRLDQKSTFSTDLNGIILDHYHWLSPFRGHQWPIA